MRLGSATLALLMLCGLGRAQDKPAPASQPKSITVPATIDHNRVVIDAEVSLPDGSVQRVHAWVDNGSSDLELSRRLAMALGLAVACDDHECTSPPPAAIRVGGMTIPLTGVKTATIP